MSLISVASAVACVACGVAAQPSIGMMAKTRALEVASSVRVAASASAAQSAGSLFVRIERTAFSWFFEVAVKAIWRVFLVVFGLDVGEVVAWKREASLS